MSEWTDRQLLPNNILDRMQALEGRVKDLERMAARAGRGPGQLAYYEEDGALRPDSGLIVGTDVKIEDGYRLVSEGAAFMGAVGMLQMMPGLVGLWPGGSIGDGSAAFRATDKSGNGLHLTGQGSVRIGAVDAGSLVPYYSCNGSTDYLYHADHALLDISGTNAIIPVAQRGLTIGAWARFDLATGTSEGIASKYQGGGTRSYGIYKNGGGLASTLISGDGTNVTFVNSSTIVQSDKWHFIVGRFDPGTFIDIWLDGAQDGVNTTSIPSSLFNSAANFEIGRIAAANYLDGHATLCFLCDSIVPDVMIEAFYEQSKRLFE